VAEIQESEDLSFITAFVVLKTMEVDIDAVRKEIFLYVKSKLADYKNPRKIYFIESLPRNNNGKLLRKNLSSTLQK
ncbi:MAG TPA: hypothetical protein PKX55_10560, partial [Leptospiraceae bacterium]|nr:hypothetical protein [Leptospiraceae bacterium]